MPATENKQEEELRPVGPGAEDLAGEVVVTEPDDDDETIGRQAAEEDERIGRSDEDEDREAIRQRRREEKHRRKEKRQRDVRELNFLRNRNEQLERRFSELEGRQNQGEVLAVDQRIAELKSNLKLAEDTYAQAITASKGEEAAEALRIRDELRDGLRQAESVKARAVQGERQRQAPKVDPAIQSHAQSWMQENDWFDPQLSDEESSIAKAIEASVARSNRFDPRTEEYWDEVTRRCKKRLPHLFESDQTGNADEDPDEDEEKRRPRGPRMTTGGRERPLKAGEVYVSPERRKAMEEAGVWDDSVLRSRYLKQYAKWDSENGRRRHQSN